MTREVMPLGHRLMRAMNLGAQTKVSVDSRGIAGHSEIEYKMLFALQPGREFGTR